MQLNIYKISHPIIKLILNDLKNQNNKNYYYKYIGLLIIYEMFRKYIEIDEVYIKLIKNIKNITVHNYRKKYLILTDISATYDMITDIKTILPIVKIVHINYQNIEEIEYSIKSSQIQNKDTNIFILEKVTSNDNVIKLIQYLSYNHNVSTNKIAIGCITSYHETLTKIGNSYPELKIYTTEIKNNS